MSPMVIKFRGFSEPHHKSWLRSLAKIETCLPKWIYVKTTFACVLLSMRMLGPMQSSMVFLRSHRWVTFIIINLWHHSWTQMTTGKCPRISFFCLLATIACEKKSDPCLKEIDIKHSCIISMILNYVTSYLRGTGEISRQKTAKEKFKESIEADLQHVPYLLQWTIAHSSCFIH